MLHLSSEQHARPKSQLGSRGIDLNFCPVRHSIQQSQEAGFVLLQPRSVEIIASYVSEEQRTMGEKGGHEAEAELGGAVGELEGA